MDSREVNKRRGAYLPHWTAEGGIYAVTFRLADSLSREKREQLEEELRQLSIRHTSGESMTYGQKLRLRYLQSDRIQKYLNAGYGSCWMRKDHIAEVVVSALQHFDGDRYHLFAWCVMPNHVHVVVQPLGEHSLSNILHSWKRFSAREANKILGKEGSFWCMEYYDHLIRNQEDLIHQIEYIWLNPEKAGLLEWQWRWKTEDIPLL